MKTAFVFPGQGSQYVGMGKLLAEAYPPMDETFAEAEQTLKRPLREICYNGSAPLLDQTENTQAAILTVSVGVWRILDDHGIQPDIVAGHSLGEYSALVAAGSLTFTDALHLVQRRATLMAEAAAEIPGGMVAILGLDQKQVMSVCERVSEYGFVQIANINCPGQIVVSGESEALPYVVEFGLKQGAKRCVPLRVSGAFHSRLMISAAKQLQASLEQTDFSEPNIPVIANVTGNYIAGSVQLSHLLTEQVTNSVQWEATIRRMWEDDVRCFAEVGPGSVLTGLTKRTVSEYQAVSLGEPEELNAFLEMSHATEG